MLKLSETVKNILEKNSNNNSNHIVMQYRPQKAIKQKNISYSDVTPKMFRVSYDMLKASNKAFIQISHEDFFKILSTDYIKTGNEFVVFILLYILFNQYISNFSLKNIKSLVRFLHCKQKEILGDSKLLVSESTLKEIINKFKERGILKKSFFRVGHTLEIRRPDENFIQIDIKLIHQLMKEAHNSNEFYLSMFFFYNSYKHAFQNKYFGTSNESIMEYTGGKIRSTSTLCPLISRLEKKGIIKIKRVDYNTVRNHHYCFNPDFVDNLMGPPEKKAENRTGEMGVSEQKAENRTHIKKDFFVRNPLSENEGQSEQKDSCASSTSLEGVLNNLTSLLEEGAPLKINDGSAKSARFTINQAETPTEEAKEEVVVSKNDTAHRTNYGLKSKYNLSSSFITNINKMREVIAKHNFFKNYSESWILYKIFEMAHKKGSWPFETNNRPIEKPLDQYLTLDLYGKGMIFEKILLNDLKHELEEKERKNQFYSSSARQQRDFQSKVNYLMSIQDNIHLNKYEKIETQAFKKLDISEKQIMKTLKPWHHKYVEVLSKLNKIISKMVDKAFYEYSTSM